jgi:hypothetical protein
MAVIHFALHGNCVIGDLRNGMLLDNDAQEELSEKRGIVGEDTNCRRKDELSEKIWSRWVSILKVGRSPVTTVHAKLRNCQ